MTRKSADRSRRAPGDGKRDHEVTVRFTASEWARIDAAAEQAVMTMRALGELRPVAEHVAELIWSRVAVLDGRVIVISMSTEAGRRRRSG